MIFYIIENEIKTKIDKKYHSMIENVSKTTFRLELLF